MIEPAVRAKLELLAAQRALGMLDSRDLPGIAGDLLDHVDSENLAVLAGGIKHDHPGDLDALLEAGLRDCAIELPGLLEAAQRVKVHIASEVAAGRLPPLRGADEIIGIFQSIDHLLPKATKYVGDSFGIAKLYGLFNSYLDRPDRQIESELVDACRAIAAQSRKNV